MLRLLRRNLSFYVHVGHVFSLAVFCLHVDSTETRKTYRAVFSEPRVIVPGTSAAEPLERKDVVECEQSSERRLETIHTPALMEEALRSSDEQQKKRTRDNIELADTVRARKKKKTKK